MNPNKVIFIFTGKSNKILDEEVQKVKTLIKSNGEVVRGPICFKKQRQLVAFLKFNSSIDRLMKHETHKSISIRVIT